MLLELSQKNQPAFAFYTELSKGRIVQHQPEKRDITATGVSHRDMAPPIVTPYEIVVIKDWICKTYKSISPVITQILQFTVL